MSSIIMPPGTIVEHGPGVAPTGLQDNLLGESVVGGPLAAQDVRMFLDRRTLEHLLDVANASTVGRAVLHGVGVRVRVYQGGDGRTDADIWFWKQFRKAGNRVYVSPRVSIGHGEWVSVWPGKDLQKPVFQYVSDYTANGKPKTAWSVPQS